MNRLTAVLKVFGEMSILVFALCATLLEAQRKIPLKAHSLSLPEAVAVTSPSVVRVDCLGGPIGIGTGFIINDDGIVITAGHVVSIESVPKCENLLIAWPQKNQTIQGITLADTLSAVPVSVIAIDQVHDIAVLKPAGNPLLVGKNSIGGGIMANGKVMQLAPEPRGIARLDGRLSKIGTEVFTSGYPLSESTITTSSGTIAAIDQAFFYRANGTMEDKYKVDIHNNHGYSGAPLFETSTGAAIGLMKDFVTTAVENSGGQLFYNSGIAGVVPAEYIIKLLTDNHIRFHQLSQH